MSKTLYFNLLCQHSDPGDTYIIMGSGQLLQKWARLYKRTIRIKKVMVTDLKTLRQDYGNQITFIA